MHNWSDKNVDWKGIDDCVNYLELNLKRWGRINVTQAKEKFGTVRVYCNLGWNCLLNITHPGYIHYREYPKWLMTLDIYFLSRIIPYLNYVVVPYQKWLYVRLYRNCVKKYPHLTSEICCMADYFELLEKYIKNQ